jgi:hypothetical protein
MVKAQGNLLKRFAGSSIEGVIGEPDYEPYRQTIEQSGDSSIGILSCQ